MQGTVRLEARTDQGKVKTTELITLRGAPAPQGPAHAQTADPVKVFNIPGRPLEPRDAPIAEPT